MSFISSSELLFNSLILCLLSSGVSLALYVLKTLILLFHFCLFWVADDSNPFFPDLIKFQRECTGYIQSTCAHINSPQWGNCSVPYKTQWKAKTLKCREILIFGREEWFQLPARWKWSHRSVEGFLSKAMRELKKPMKNIASVRPLSPSLSCRILASRASLSTWISLKNIRRVKMPLLLWIAIYPHRYVQFRGVLSSSGQTKRKPQTFSWELPHLEILQLFFWSLMLMIYMFSTLALISFIFNWNRADVISNSKKQYLLMISPSLLCLPLDSD